MMFGWILKKKRSKQGKGKDDDEMEEEKVREDIDKHIDRLRKITGEIKAKKYRCGPELEDA